MRTLLIIIIFVGCTFPSLKAQSNPVVNIGRAGELVWSTDGYIDAQGNKIAILAIESGVAIGSFNSIYAPNWVKIVANYSSTINKLIPLSNGDFVALIVQDFSNASHILKFDSQGNIHWHKKLQGPPASNLNEVIESGTNKIAFIGRNGVNPIYTVMDFNGDIVYSKTFNCMTFPSVYHMDILPTGDGNHLIISHIFSSDAPKIMLSKFDESGNLLWDKVHDFPYTVTARSGIISSHGDLFVVGSYNPSMAIGDLNSRDLLLLKFSSDGDFLQAKTYGNIFEEELYDIEEDIDGTFLAVGKLKASSNCSGNLLIVNFDQNLDTLYTKIYGTEVGNGAFFHELHRRGSDYYSFGYGSLWSNIGIIGDAHLIQSDKNFDLGCEYYASGLQNSGTIIHALLDPIVTYPEFNPNFIDDAQEETVSLSVTDACSGEVLSTDELEQSPVLVAVFPVPTSDYLTIKMQIAELEELEIFDLKGRLFFKQTGGFTSEVKIQIADWPNQHYLLVLKHSDGVILERVLKMD